MNIYYLSGVKIPSHSHHSVHVMKMSESFARAGAEVTLFARKSGSKTVEEICERYGVETIFKLDYSLKTLLLSVPNAKKIQRKTKSFSPDLIYGPDLLALARMRNYQSRLVYEAQGLPVLPAHKFAFRAIVERDNFMGIVVTSDSLRQAFLKKYNTLESDKVFVAHDGAEILNRTKRFAVKKVTLKGRPEAFKVGYTGTLHASKGISLIAELSQMRPEYEFHIIGGTNKQVQKFQTEYFRPNLHFYGLKNHAEISSYLTAFDVCIAPYQHAAVVKTGANFARWLSPMKVFEYMAAKRPIICSDFPVLHEFLSDGYNALLRRASDPDGWVNALDRLKAEPDFAKSLADNAYLDLSHKYTWDKRAIGILRFATKQPFVVKHERQSKR